MVADAHKSTLPSLAHALKMCVKEPMPSADKRNVLQMGPEMARPLIDIVRRLIRDEGGVLTVWAVLHEDVYETNFGDGFYLHVRGIALNAEDANRLAALGGGDSQFAKWHVRSYQLGLENDLPSFLAPLRPEEEFTINQFVTILCDIPRDGTASKLSLP